jgi:hypothetical protein
MYGCTRGKRYDGFAMMQYVIFLYRKLDESEAVSLLDISVQNLTFLPARLFQVSLLYTWAT